MKKTRAFGQRQQGDPPRLLHGPMARSRHFLSRPVMRCLMAAAGVTTLLSMLVILANNCVVLRCDNAALRSERDYLEAAVATKTRDWNLASAPDVVISRAETELGLFTPDGPGIVIVRSDAAKECQVPAWWRFLGTVGGGGDAVETVSAQSR